MTIIEEVAPEPTSNFVLPPDPAPVETVKQEPRPYIVLVQDNPETWVKVGVIPANSAEQAIRKAVEAGQEIRISVKSPGTFLKPEGATTLVAVPMRSWNPVQVSLKTETSVVLS